MEIVKKFFKKNISTILTAIIVAVIGVVIVKVLLKILKKIFTKTKVEHTAVTFIISVARIFLYFIVILTVFSTLGINVTSIITALGAASLAAGLALQDTLSNLVSGLIILLNKPFVAGDILEFEGIKGTVSSIKFFATTINTLDNKLVTIPNSRLTTNNVVNCTMVEKRRIDLKYIVSYDDDIIKVKEVLYSLIETNDMILKDPSPAVYVGEHLDSGIEIIVLLWSNTDDYYPVYYFMQENVKLIFDREGITIPYPHMVVKTIADNK